MKLFFALSLVTFYIFGIQNTSFAQSQSNTIDSVKASKLLNAFVGEWVGEATAYFPRDKEQKKPERKSNRYRQNNFGWKLCRMQHKLDTVKRGKQGTQYLPEL